MSEEQPAREEAAAASPDNAGEKVSKKRRHHVSKGSYARYIYATLKNEYPSMGINQKGMATLVSFMEDAFTRIMTEATELARMHKHTTLTDREVIAALTMLMEGELLKHCRLAANGAIKRHNDVVAKHADDGEKPKPAGKSKNKATAK